MTTRRIAYWWFRFVFSGRFLETFLVGRHARSAAPFARKPEAEGTQPELRTSPEDGREGRSRPVKPGTENGFSADQPLAERRAVLDHVASLPGKVGQSSGE